MVLRVNDCSEMARLYARHDKDQWRRFLASKKRPRLEALLLTETGRISHTRKLKISSLLLTGGLICLQIKRRNLGSV